MDSELYGVRRRSIDESFGDGEHCAICGTDDEKLVEVAVIGEDECAVVCEVCLSKHGQQLDEDADEIDSCDGSDDGLHDDMDGDMR